MLLLWLHVQILWICIVMTHTVDLWLLCCNHSRHVTWLLHAQLATDDLLCFGWLGLTADCGLEKYKRTCTLASSQSNPSYHLLAQTLSAFDAIKLAYVQLRLEGYNSATFNSVLSNRQLSNYRTYRCRYDWGFKVAGGLENRSFVGVSVLNRG